ncbi:hypothetical protein VSDG_04912 [Cytospora chrysosperma]|uniref:Zn(2)-C6 fungal-type domain-containing protein n=1 Tax=Cytospora chrysosperma TaxID=252740 RepID=A0A423W3N1_CYTCH|nr:hypothetical protein VSDG_04912 [Valsa sordida]
MEGDSSRSKSGSQAESPQTTGSALSRAQRGAIAAQACDTCRSRKQKCDEQRPKCGTCQKFKLGCRYREPQPTKKDKTLVEILERMKTLEDKIDNLAAQGVASPPSTFVGPLVQTPTPIAGGSSASGSSSAFMPTPLADISRMSGNAALYNWDTMQTLTKAFFDTYNLLHPIVDRHAFVSITLPAIMANGLMLDDSVQSTLACLIFALGEVAVDAYNDPSQDLSRSNTAHPPGLVFFNEARRRMGFNLTECSLENVQIFALAGSFSPELGMPVTGLDKYEALVRVPDFGGILSQEDYVSNQASHYQEHFASQIVLRRLSANFHSVLGSGAGLPMFTTNLEIQPAAYPYATDVQVALLRTRYYITKHMIHRPFLYKALHHADQMTREDAEGVATCLRACLKWPLTMSPACTRKRLIPCVFFWTQNLLGVLIILHLSEQVPILLQIRTSGICGELFETEASETVRLAVQWIRDLKDADSASEWAWGVVKGLYNLDD